MTLQYIRLQEIDTLIVISLYTAWRWLYQLGYKYKDLYKDIFVNGHEQSNIVNNCKNFLKKIEEFKPYVMKFEKDDIMKLKVYPSSCIIKEDKCRPTIIIIPHDEYIFSINNGVQRVSVGLKKEIYFYNPKVKDKVS